MTRVRILTESGFASASSCVVELPDVFVAQHGALDHREIVEAFRAHAERRAEEKARRENIAAMVRLAAALESKGDAK